MNNEKDKLKYKFARNLKLEKYYEEPKNKYNLVSVTIFRLYKNYKSMSEYYDKFNVFLQVFKKYLPDFYLRVYIDDSIIIKPGIEIIDKEIDEVWSQLIKNLKSLDFVQLVKYKHLNFLDREYPQCHRGAFGTMIRFLPMFDYKVNNNLNKIIIMDIDMNPKKFNLYIKSLNYLEKNNLKFLFRTSYCSYTLIRYDVEELLNTWLRVMAGTMILHNYRFSKEILNKFFGCIYHNNYTISKCKYIKKFKKYDESKRNINKKLINDEVFKFGIDELLTSYLLNDLISNNVKFGYLSTKNMDLPLFVHANINNFYENENDNDKKLIEVILGKYYDNSKTVKENYKFLDNKLGIANYNYDKADNLSKYIYDNYTKMFISFKNNNYQNDYGFTKEEIKCVIKQMNIKNYYNYSLFESKDILSYN